MDAACGVRRAWLSRRGRRKRRGSSGDIGAREFQIFGFVSKAAAIRCGVAPADAREPHNNAHNRTNERKMQTAAMIRFPSAQARHSHA
jgi:hypothetical protein